MTIHLFFTAFVIRCVVTNLVEGKVCLEWLPHSDPYQRGAESGLEPLTFRRIDSGPTSGP